MKDDLIGAGNQWTELSTSRAPLPDGPLEDLRALVRQYPVATLAAALGVEAGAIQRAASGARVLSGTRLAVIHGLGRWHEEHRG
jgi:hypothetical protein